MSMTTFPDLISFLLFSQNVSQKLHWATKSFAKHVALGELYASLATETDALNEMWMGRYGSEHEIPVAQWQLDQSDPNVFVEQLQAALAEFKKTVFNEGDDFIKNKFEELEAAVSHSKYKLNNLN